MKWNASLRTLTRLSMTVRTNHHRELGGHRRRGSQMSNNSMCESGPNARASSCRSVETGRNEPLRDSASLSAEVDVSAAVAFRRQARWLAENRNALDSSNTFVEQHGLPLARYRRF